jgi:HAD superfamily hydrolase (TIGR01662 family)
MFFYHNTIRTLDTMSHPPILIFDVDGVLLNSTGHLKAAQELLDDPSIPWNPEMLSRIQPIDLLRKFETSDRTSLYQSAKVMYQNFQDILPRKRSRFRFLARLGKTLRKFRNYEFQYSDFNPGVVDAIQNLAQQGVLMGICTNAESPRLKKWLKKKDLDKIIRCYVSRDDKKRYGIKPEGRPILATILRIKQEYKLGKIDKTRVAFVGDNITDIKAAHNAGIKSIAVTTGHGRIEDLKKLSPTFVLESVTAIPSVLLQLFPPF